MCVCCISCVLIISLTQWTPVTTTEVKCVALGQVTPTNRCVHNLDGESDALHTALLASYTETLTHGVSSKSVTTTRRSKRGKHCPPDEDNSCKSLECKRLLEEANTRDTSATLRAEKAEAALTKRGRERANLSATRKVATAEAALATQAQEHAEELSACEDGWAEKSANIQEKLKKKVKEHRAVEAKLNRRDQKVESLESTLADVRVELSEAQDALNIITPSSTTTAGRSLAPSVDLLSLKLEHAVEQTKQLKTQLDAALAESLTRSLEADRLRADYVSLQSRLDQKVDKLTTALLIAQSDIQVKTLQLENVTLKLGAAEATTKKPDDFAQFVQQKSGLQDQLRLQELKAALRKS